MQLDEKSQTSLEYLYLTSFVIGLAAITALLVQDIIAIQEQAKEKITDYRERLLRRIIQ